MGSTSAMQLERPPALVPPAWARGGHAQTLLAHVLRSRRDDISTWTGARRVDVPVGEGDRMVGFFVPGESGVVVALFHGLAGDTKAEYMRRVAQLARERGHGIWAVNHRGCWPGDGLSRRPYHSGCWPDVAAALEVGRSLAPGTRTVAVGFSLSGNVLALLMGKAPLEQQPDAAVCVNAPIDLASCSDLIGRGLNRIYDLRFVRDLRRSVEERRQLGMLGQEEARIPPFASLRVFDELYTAPQSGFASAADYYERCSAAPWLERIKRPTVLLTAADDPFVSAQPYREARHSGSVHVHVEEVGGHLGYLSGPPTPRGDRQWLDQALGSYLDQLVCRL